MQAYEKLRKAISDKNTYLCIGLDTDAALLPHVYRTQAYPMYEYNKKIIDATSDLCAGYKVSAAFYEKYGAEGIEEMQKTIEYIPEEALIILDAKRGDIGNTAEAYAYSAFERHGADSVTINPYMGIDSAEPFLKWKDKLVFVLGLTSNPGSADIQRIVSEGEPVYKRTIRKFAETFPKENLGFVVGATHPGELAELRNMLPETSFLIPGVGTQGGNVKEVLKANKQGPALINVSRAIIYASKEEDFINKVRAAAQEYKNQLIAG